MAWHQSLSKGMLVQGQEGMPRQPTCLLEVQSSLLSQHWPLEEIAQEGSRGRPLLYRTAMLFE